MRFYWKNLLYPPPRIKRLKDLQREAQEEARYLAGRHSRAKDVLRVSRIAFEYIRGMLALNKIGPAVTVFGSARFREGHPFYQLGREMGTALARQGFTVMTG